MKTNLNFRALYQSVVIALILVGFLSAGAYLAHLLFSTVFGSLSVFSSLFVVAVGLGAWVTYDDKVAQQGEGDPRVIIQELPEKSGDE